MSASASATVSNNVSNEISQSDLTQSVISDLLSTESENTSTTNTDLDTLFNSENFPKLERRESTMGDFFITGNTSNVDNKNNMDNTINTGNTDSSTNISLFSSNSGNNGLDIDNNSVMTNIDPWMQRKMNENKET